MNYQSHSLQNQKLKRARHFYSIIEEPHASESQEGEELSKLLRRGNQFLYIDINEQKGFKLMEPCRQKLVQEDSLHFGENYITNLQNLSTISSKTVSLMLQLKDDINKKEKSSFLMAEEIKKKREKLRQIGSLIVRKEKSNNTIVKPMVYKGMPSELIENLMWSRQNEQMQNQIKKRQSLLMQHYSTIKSGENHNQAKLEQMQKGRKCKEYLSEFKHLKIKR